MNFFKKIREIREKLGLNQKDFAKLLNTTQVTISRYEQNERFPDINFIISLIETCNINPTWLFLDVGDMVLINDYPNLNSYLLSQLSDMTMMFSEDRLKNIFEKIIIDELLSKFTQEGQGIIRKLLDLIDPNNPIKTRPFLFLYYIFQIISLDTTKENISNYREYLVNTIMNYKVISFKNKPFFTDAIKNEMKDFIEYKMSEKECALLIKNSHHTLEQLEKTMPISMIKAHRNMFK